MSLFGPVFFKKKKKSSPFLFFFFDQKIPTKTTEYLRTGIKIAALRLKHIV